MSLKKKSCITYILLGYYIKFLFFSINCYRLSTSFLLLYTPEVVCGGVRTCGVRSGWDWLPESTLKQVKYQNQGISKYNGSWCTRFLHWSLTWFRPSRHAVYGLLYTSVRNIFETHVIWRFPPMLFFSIVRLLYSYNASHHACY